MLKLLSALSGGSKKKEGFDIDLWNSKNHSNIGQVMKVMKTKPADTLQNYYRPDKSNLYYLEFEGDIQASEAAKLKQEILVCLQVAKPTDVFLILVESSGGSVSNYGDLYSVMEMIKKRGHTLWVAIDRVAASGGYLISLPADKIFATPFALIGSIGVLSEVPNFGGLLDKYGVKMEEYTAGERKMNISMFRENGEEQKEHHRKKLGKIHELFKAQLVKYRGGLIEKKGVDIGELMEGDFWMGENAFELGLVDELKSSVEILLDEKDHFNILKVNYHNEPKMAGIMGMLKPKMKFNPQYFHQMIGFIMSNLAKK